MDETDPFSCFGDDDDDGVSIDEIGAQKEENKQEKPVERDPSCGILAFHPGTEQAMLKHVENALLQYKEGISRADFILDSIDRFCLQRHWMMHVGNEKAIIIRAFVQECCSACPPGHRLVFVELGTYCGYSSILFAKTLSQIGYDFRIYSVEVEDENAQVAKDLIKLSGFQDEVEVLILDLDKENLAALLRRKLESRCIDFLFIDHDKSLYLSDLKELEGSGLIKKGCFVAADNVVFARIHDYRKYMSDLASKRHISTRLEESTLEYSIPDCVSYKSKKDLLKDGIGT